MKKISIIIPVYNGEKHICKCLESIRSQTYKNIEIIVIDDGSVDSTRSLVLQLKTQDNRIKLKTVENSGVSSARNIGLDLASGTYVTFIDSDDYIENNHIARLYDNIEEKKVDSVFGLMQLKYDDKLVKQEKRLEQGSYLTKDLYSIMIDDGKLNGILMGSVCTGLYNLDVIKKEKIYFNESLTVNEDGVFNIMYLLKSKSLYIDNSIKSYIYRQHKENIIKDKCFQRNLNKATDAIIDILPANLNVGDQLSYRFVSIALWTVIHICKTSKNYFFEAKNELNYILKQDKFRESVKFIDDNTLIFYKKVYLVLMKYNLTFSLYFLTKFLAPYTAVIVKKISNIIKAD